MLWKKTNIFYPFCLDKHLAKWVLPWYFLCLFIKAMIRRCAWITADLEMPIPTCDMAWNYTILVWKTLKNSVVWGLAFTAIFMYWLTDIGWALKSPSTWFSKDFSIIYHFWSLATCIVPLSIVIGTVICTRWLVSVGTVNYQQERHARTGVRWPKLFSQPVVPMRSKLYATKW